jgi:hypothetical protein
MLEEHQQFLNDVLVKVLVVMCDVRINFRNLSSESRVPVDIMCVSILKRKVTVSIFLYSPSHYN